jgi:dipeptidyl aminopeptidase/acylaminoacyl peptidase
MPRHWILAVVPLALCAAAAPATASFPGRNGVIAYEWVGESAYRAGPTHTAIRTVHPRTGEVRVLHDCPIRQGPYTDCSVGPPAYAPDGSRLAFPIIRITPNFTGQPWRFDPGLATMPADGSAMEERATAQRYFALAWSPAGDRLLLERESREPSYPTGHSLFLAALDGTELGRRTPALTHAPDWSWRGEIAFGRYRDTSCLPVCADIFVSGDGGDVRRLTYRGGSTPSWAPGGKRLAFARRSRGRTNIYIVRRSGRGLRRLTKRGGFAPAWSPDGRWIAFIRNDDIRVIRTNGRDGRRLVDGMLPPGAEEGPLAMSLDWQALPRR